MGTDQPLDSGLQANVDPSATMFYVDDRVTLATPEGVGSALTARVDVRDLLLQISRDLVSAGNLEELLQTMVDAALEIAPSADRCVIHLLNSQGTMLQARVCSPPSLMGCEPSDFPANIGVAGRALRERMTVRIDDTSTSPDFVPLRSGPELRSLLVAPLYVRDLALGTLSLSGSRPQSFSATTSRYISTLASQASVAIHQARLLREAVTERERSDAIIEGITDGLLILDDDQRVVRVNPALCDLLQLPREALDRPEEILQSEPYQQRIEALLGTLCGQVVGVYEVELPLAPETRVTLQVTPAPLPAPAQGQVRVVHDVTAEREAAERRALFISQVSHELRTPLQHILGFASLISDIDDLSRDDYRHFIGHIQNETDHLTRLVNDLVELSRIETGRFAVYLEQVQIDQLAADVVRKLLPRAETHNLELSLENITEPTWITSDSLRLEQVLGNLIENAFKFVPSGGSIHVTVELSSQDVTVHVTDTGPGIPPEDLPYIFDRFYQVRPKASQRNVGMGLGLFISREIIHTLGGQIWVESILGQGSTFSFRLPGPLA